jgi:AraC-like DNA-binding protein
VTRTPVRPHTAAMTTDLEDLPTRGFHMHTLPVTGALSDCVRALMAVQIDAREPLPLAIAPHESLMLTVQFGRDGADAKAPLGRNTHLTGIRQWTGSFTGAGHCVSLFALLTPLGAVRLLDSRALDSAPRIRAPVAELLDDTLTRTLESAVAQAGDVDAQLRAFAAWLEARAVERSGQSRAALRAARAAMRLCDEPRLSVERAADEQHVGRRQLERDFERWIGAAPRHLAQVARMQQMARSARAGASLADAAVHAGFADQPHMTRTVRRLTGLTPRRFIGSLRTPIAAAFRAATGGGTVYL